jgi:uncharacterized protein (DUF58 family)
MAATLGIAALGALGGRATFFVVAVVPAAVLGVGAVAAPPRPSVTVERDLSTASPELGERVRVRVAVTNDGETMADCRVADTPPDGLAAVEPTRQSVRLPAGETAVLAYDVVAHRGRHTFGPVCVTARGILEERGVETHPETTVRCRPDDRPLELGGAATRHLRGRPGDAAGSGVEFHAVREYRPSDPQRRVDWRRYARTRELTTVQFREESTETVHLLVDTTPSGAVRGHPAWPSAVAYCADAVERLAGALAARGTLVGVGLYPDLIHALPAGNGPAHDVRLRRLLDRHDAFPWGDDDTLARSTAVTTDGGLPDGLDADARVLVVSPCLDDAPVEFVANAAAAGYDVGVVTPDVGGTGPGATVERALRADRLARLDGLSVPLVDWDVEAPLEAAVAEVFATWT